MKLTERSLAPSVSLIDFVHVVRVEDIGQDPAGSSYKAQVQQLLDLVEPSLYLTGGTYNPNTGILELTDNTGGTITVSGTYSFEDTDNKQNSMIVDGFGVKYPTVDAVNFQVNSVALASINTGFIDVSDSFIMTRPDDFTLRLNPSNKGLIYQSILQTPPYAPSTAILNIPLTDIPLSGISFTGNGVYVRFVGYDDTGTVVYSDSTYETSISVVQLGVILLKVSGGTTSFLDSTRGIINKPSICKYDNLEIHMFGLKSDVIVRPNSGMSINNTAGSIKGMSVNWQGADNDIRPVASTGITQFTHLSFLNTMVATPPVFTSAVTTDQYWNGTFLQNLSTSGAASIQRWYVTINGRLGLQYGEQEFASLQIAKDNVGTATFLDVIPTGTFAEVARMVAIRDTTDLSNTLQCVFYSNTGGGSAGGSSSTVWGQINGSLTDQVDLKAALDLKQNIISTGGTANIVPKWNITGTTLINSNITDYGTGVTISTDINVNSINIGRGKDSSNLFVGYQALGTASTTNNTSVAFGDYALGSLTTGGTNNTALGYSSLYKTTTGNENTAIGQYAAYFNTTGQYNLAIGNSALQSNIGSTQNVAIGAFALYTFTGGSGGHTAIGVSAMQKQINGESNLAVGNSALYNGTTCIRNTAIGTLAMYGRLNIPITGQYNIAVGFQASRAITTGSNNLVIGLELNDGITTGNNNIILDPINRPGISTGSGNVVIGGFNSTIPDTSNGVYIGTGAGIMRMFFDSAGTMSISTTPLIGTSDDKLLVRTSTGLIKQIDNPISSGTTGTTGQVAFYNSSTTLSGSTAFTWNDITKRLIINGSISGIGNTIDIQNNTVNTGLNINNISASTRPFSYKQNGIEKTFIIDNGNITSPKFITTGGNAGQVVLGDGTLGSYAPISNGVVNFIAKYTSATAQAPSRLLDDGSFLGIGSVSPIALTKDIQLGRQTNKEIGVEQSDSLTIGRDLIVTAGRTINFQESSNFLALGGINRNYTYATVSYSGDVYVAADDIYKQTGGAGNFITQGAGSKQWVGIAVAPNGDVYASVGAGATNNSATGDIYKQTGGVGGFVAMGQTIRPWAGMCAAPNGDIYAAEGGGFSVGVTGDIYKLSGGTFVALGQGPKVWQGMYAAPNGDIFAVVRGGDIYKQTGGVGNFVAQGQTSRTWNSITKLLNGDFIAATGYGGNSGDIYKQTGGVGSFVSLGQTIRTWDSVGSNGIDVYAVVYSGDIYKQSNASLGTANLQGGTLKLKSGTAKGTGQSRVQIITGQITVSGTNMQNEQVVAEFNENGNTIFNGNIIKSGGTSNQFLMADGSVTVGGIVGSGSANSVAKWSSSSALTTSNINDTGSLITLNSSTNINGIATLLTTAISGRETLFQASITDNAVDKIMIANGTSVGGRFAPGFVGYTQGGYGAIFFRGLGATADDLSANTPYVTFLAANTSLSADPNNGTLTAPSARPMFSWGSVTTYMTMAASGNLLIQNGGTFTDNLTDRLQVGGSVVATSYKINGGSTTQLLKADGTLTTGYRVYTALITQTGTANPSVIILENNMTDTIVWTRTGAGTYQGLATNPIFTTNKTVVFTTKDIGGGADVNFNGSSPGVNQVFLTTVNNGGGQDGSLTNATIEIRVYN